VENSGGCVAGSLRRGRPVERETAFGVEIDTAEVANLLTAEFMELLNRVLESYRE